MLKKIKLTKDSKVVQISAQSIGNSLDELAYGELWIPIELYVEHEDYFKNKIYIKDTYFPNVYEPQRNLYFKQIEVTLKDILTTSKDGMDLHKEHLTFGIHTEEITENIKKGNYNYLNRKIKQAVADDLDIDILKLVSFDSKIQNIMGLFSNFVKKTLIVNTTSAFQGVIIPKGAVITYTYNNETQIPDDFDIEYEEIISCKNKELSV